MRELPPAGSSLRDAVFAINQLIRGRSNAVGSVTLTASATSTTVTGAFNRNAVVLLSPQTANAAAALATTHAVVTDANTVTITHANAGSTDRSFAYVVLGG